MKALELVLLLVPVIALIFAGVLKFHKAILHLMWDTAQFDARFAKTKICLKILYQKFYPIMEKIKVLNERNKKDREVIRSLENELEKLKTQIINIEQFLKNL